jgi:thiol-disulfide isomerase/thioredoxin
LEEENLLLRQALWIKYLDTLFPNPESKRITPSNLIDPELVSKALDELTPMSPFWMLRWLFPDDYLQKAVLATGQPERYQDYAERSIESWPYGIRGWGFSSLIKKAREKGETKEADRLYQSQQLLSPESEAAKFEKLQLERKARAKVVAGTQVPPFKAHSLGDSAVIYTPQNINAKIYLIDFWATWCGPCYKEFPYLHSAYEQFHDKGFEILSFSIDSSTEAIFRSRKGKFPMPWLHAIDPQFQTIDSEMAKQFEVFGIPSAFLVDGSGKILATTEELWKEKLLEALNEFFKDN